MNSKEALQTIIDIVDKIEKTDNEIIKNIKMQKIVLLNLKIQSSHIKENTGINPIIDNLNKSIEGINTSLRGLIDNNRASLIDAIKVLSKELKTNNM